MSLLVGEAVAVVKGGRSVVADANFSAAAGEFIGLVGPNGAGKSTLLRTLCGLEKPASGRVLLDGTDIATIAPRNLARRRAYLPQHRELAWNRSVEAVVSLGRFAYGSSSRVSEADAAAVARALAATDIAAFRNRDAHTLSGGEAARMHLARALAAETPILLADEPTASLDPRHQLAIMNILSARAAAGALVVAALHDLDLAARACTRIVVMNDGRIVADGAPAEALAADRLRSVFGVERRDGGYALSP